ncbi:MAG TPA: universal stress protein [Acidimicrobiia bacterium]|jgi:nucleotide-binding universal stress UspA family protein
MSEHTIVVGYNHSGPAKAALRWATEQAVLTSGEVLAVYVASAVADWELAAVQFDPDPMRRELERCLEGAWTEWVRARHVPCRTRFVYGRPAEELMKIARAEQAQLIVIGMSPRGTLTELISGSTMHDLRKHAVRPVVAVPHGWPEAAAAS